MSFGSSLSDIGVSKKKALATAIVATLLAGTAVGLIAKAASFHKTLHALEHATYWWFILCLAGEAVAYAGYIFAYRDFARAARGPKLRWLEAGRVVGVGIGANILGATVAALAVDFWALNQAGAKVHESARRVLALNTMEWANLSVMAVLAAIAVLAGAGKGAPYEMTLSWIIIVPLCYLGSAWFTSPSRIRRFTKMPKTSPPLRLARKTWRPWAIANLRKGFADAIGGVAIVRHIMANPRSYPAGNIGYYVYWIGHIFTLYAAISAFGYSIDPAPLILAYATTYLLTILPLPAGGAGGMEAVLTYVLHLVGMPLHLALASAFTFRFFTFWLPILPALILLPTVGGLREQLSNKQRDKTTPQLKHVQLLHH